jgi:hypothetical protein
MPKVERKDLEQKDLETTTTTTNVKMRKAVLTTKITPQLPNNPV